MIVISTANLHSPQSDPPGCNHDLHSSSPGASSAARRLRRRSVLVLLTAIAWICTATASSHWAAGPVAGWIMPQGDFGYYWSASPGAGFSLTYPFHPRVPITFSVLASRHKPSLPREPLRAGYLIPDTKVALFNFSLTAGIHPLPPRPIEPVLLAGLNCNTFLAYRDRIDPRAYLGETEIGIHGGVGVDATLRDRLRLRLGYLEQLTFSRPRALLVGMFVFEISLLFNGSHRQAAATPR